jgi:hypothetical protein
VPRLRFREDQNGADEILAPIAHIEFFIDVLQKLLNFLIGPDVLALIVRNNIEAFSERLLDRVFVVLNFGHGAPMYLRFGPQAPSAAPHRASQTAARLLEERAVVQEIWES